MKPVDQTIFGNGKGNCFAACVASILELQIEDVPNFCIEQGDWLAAANKWMGRRGLGLMDVSLADDGGFGGNMCAMAGGAWAVISGKSPRGDFTHVTVGRYRMDEEAGTHRMGYEHDPHPSRDYLDGPATAVTFFITVEPWLNAIQPVEKPAREDGE